MSSKSQTTDQTKAVSETNILDRKAVQGQGTQILDSVIYDPSDEVVKRAMDSLQAGLFDLTERNSVTVKSFLDMTMELMGLADKGQVQMSEFGYKALTNARDQLEAMENQGAFVIKMAEGTVDRSFDLASQVATFQAQAQRDAMEILGETRTADFSDNLKTLTAMVMLFALASLWLAKKV